jgi:hypothetical protein
MGIAAICSTKDKDVKACVEEMKGGRYGDGILYQFAGKTYVKLEKDQSSQTILPATKPRKVTHIITTTDGKIHKKTCKKAKVRPDQVRASIVRVDLTGLKKCSCMK